MKPNRVYSVPKQTMLVMAVIALLLLGSRPGATQEKPKSQEQVLYSFQNNGQDGYDPGGGLVFDKAGNFYGTTFFGGTGGCTNTNFGVGCGTVFELSPQSGGGWSETVLYSFQETPDGAQPLDGLIFDQAGNLYGTCYLGGSGNGCGGFGCGTVFELSPQSGGGWSETVLHSFQADGRDGIGPQTGLIFDKAGNLYGTTTFGGRYPSECLGNGCGTIFELSPQSGGGWSETLLHSFSLTGFDGKYPIAGLVFDNTGNLYGTTLYGGSGGCIAEYDRYGCGTVFELSPQSGGSWAEAIVHNFQSKSRRDGNLPSAGLILDSAGNLYGTTEGGGGNGECCGTVFEFSPQSGRGWFEKGFSFNRTDGSTPFASLVFDSAGNLYGTTDQGGTVGSGTVFEFSPQSGGGWAETVLHSFQNNGSDGTNPGSLVIGKDDNLYGITSSGGSGGYGTVFEIAP